MLRSLARSPVFAAFAPSGRARDGAASLSPSEQIVRTVFILELLAVVVFQKVGVPVGETSIALGLPAMWAGLAAIALSSRLLLDPIRLLLFSAFGVSALISQLMVGREFSGASMFLALSLYIPMCVRLKVSRALYLSCLNAFQVLMLIMLAVVVAQHLVQLTVGWRYWPDLDKILPPMLRVPHFNYLQPMAYGSRFEKPNGIVFLEVSYLSQFAALALIVEAVYFRRIWRLAAFALLVLLTFAGTGILILAVTAPLLLSREGPRTFALAVAGAGVLIAVAIVTGWFHAIEGRIFEFQQQGTSGYYRFVVPAREMFDRARDPGFLLTGIGAGNTPLTIESPLAPVKVASEYGFVPMLLFCVFFVYAMFAGAPSKRLSLGFLAFYLLGGASFALALPVLSCVLFCTLLYPSGEERHSEHRSWWKNAQPTPARALGDGRGG